MGFSECNDSSCLIPMGNHHCNSEPAPLFSLKNYDIIKIEFQMLERPFVTSSSHRDMVLRGHVKWVKRLDFHLVTNSYMEDPPSPPRKNNWKETRSPLDHIAFCSHLFFRLLGQMCKDTEPSDSGRHRLSVWYFYNTRIIQPAARPVKHRQNNDCGPEAV